MGIRLLTLLGNRMPCGWFPFDLATVLGRETPDFNPNAKLFAEMEQDEVLQKLN